jgi:hypothetical protein
MGKKTWTSKEIKFLKNNYGVLRICRIASLLNRTSSSILSKIRKLKLELNHISMEDNSKNRTGLKWTQEEDLFLINNKNILTYRGMVPKLHREIGSIKKRVIKLGIARKPKEVNIGDKFGKLTVSHLEYKDRKGEIFNCKCECGNTTVVRKSRLISKNPRWQTNSCGCLRTEKLQEKMAYNDDTVSFSRLYSVYKHRAKKNGKSFNLLFEYFKYLIVQNCYYCGRHPIPYNSYVKDDGTDAKSKTGGITLSMVERAWIQVNTIDRKDSNIGYELDNCVPCCHQCNWMKNDYTSEEYIKRSYEVVAFQESKKVQK